MDPWFVLLIHIFFSYLIVGQRFWHDKYSMYSIWTYQWWWHAKSRYVLELRIQIIWHDNSWFKQNLSSSMVDDVVGSSANAFHFNFECLKTLMLTRSCLSSPHIHISNFFCIWRFSRDRKLVVIEGVKDIGVIRKSWNHLIRRRKWWCQVLLIFILEYF